MVQLVILKSEGFVRIGLRKRKTLLYMRYRVLVEALVPKFTWIEIESTHPLDSIDIALQTAEKLPNGAFVDAADLELGIGLQASNDVESLVVLAVVDDSGMIQYTRSEQIDTLKELEQI